MVVGMALVLSSPFILEAQSSAIEVSEASQQAEIQKNLNGLERSIERVSEMDKYSQTNYTLTLNQDLEDVKVVDNAVVFSLNRSGQQTNFTRIFDTSLESDPIPTEQGAHEIRLVSQGEKVKLETALDPKENLYQELIGIKDTSDWNNGYFTRTTTDKESASRQLSMGYLNGTNPRSADLEEGLVGYWRLDRESGDVIDYSGEGNDGAPQNGVNRGVDGVFGTQAFEFNYSNQEYVSHPDLSSKFDDEATISLWLKRSDQNTPGDSSATGLFNYGYNQNNDRSHYPWTDGNLYLSTFSDDRLVDGLDNTGFDKTKWHHFLITTEPGENNYRVYQNGTLIAEREGPQELTLPSNMRFGYSDDSYYFNGKMDEVRLYNRSLSEQEVNELYLNGYPYSGNYTSEVIEESSSQGWSKLEIDAGVPSDTELTAEFQTLTDNVISSLEKRIESNSDWNSGSFNGSTADRVEESYSVSKASVSSQLAFNSGSFNGTSADRKDNSGELGLGYRNGSSSDNLVGHWRFDWPVNGNGGNILDYSGYDSDGTTKNGVSTGKQGVFGTNSFNFDGEDDYLDIGNNLISPGSSVTYSAWVKPTSQSANNGAGVITEMFDPSESNVQFEIWITSNGVGAGSSPSWTAGIYDGSWHYAISNQDIESGEWQHVVGTYDGQEIKLYVNGELKDSTSFTGGLPAPDEPYRIGMRHDTNDDIYFDGKIDEPRIYNRSLSQSEVEDLYFDGIDSVFKGDYSAEKIDNDELTNWNQIEIDSSVPSDTGLSAEFEALDSSGSVIDSRVIDVSDGSSNYSLSVSDSEDARVKFNGTSSNVSKSWEVHDFEVYSQEADVLSDGLRLGYRNGSAGDDLVGYWRLDREFGSVVDYSGEGNDGVTRNFDGDERAVGGVFGTRAFDFDGQDDYVRIENSGRDFSNTNRAISFWAKAESWKSENIFNSEEFSISAGSDGNSMLFNGDPSGGNSGAKGFSFNPENGKWYHFVALVDQNNNVESAYLNGESRNLDINNGWYIKQGNLIGARNRDSPSVFWEGSLDEIRIYNRSLSDAEIKELYLNGKPFQGNYSAEVVEKDWVADWEKVGLNASVPSGTDLSIRFRPLDSDGGVLDEQVIDVENTGNYSLSVEDSRRAEVLVNGSSSNVTKTWNLYDLEVYSSRPEVGESESFDVQDGLKNYSIGLSDSDGARVRFNGSSSNVSRSWNVSDLSIFTKE